jgi:hypothetical protein
MDSAESEGMKRTAETWRLVELKLEELRSLTTDSWNNQNWEMAALGERTMRATQDAMHASKEAHNQLTNLNVSLDNLRETFEKIKEPQSQDG